ncbi:hypothetical protein MKJ04_22470 [Pontibacter sp. E15-1]|uniref:hypothetical protein n=1 Tax=Pontibacter sp. E15-1 TaxID=2919918 RepID=UPI001F4FE6C0|nr:hypothetical protein [Pontibacter sp. E15-1]MCJ8167625.1 hypothetical protein [Pontibacter sp. E15-1]
MKHTLKLAFAAVSLLAFSACSNGNDSAATESEHIESTDQIETDMETDMMDTTTTPLDTTMQDGSMNDIQEEQPPMN